MDLRPRLWLGLNYVRRRIRFSFSFAHFPPSIQPSPHGEGEPFAVPLKIRAPGFTGLSETVWAWLRHLGSFCACGGGLRRISESGRGEGPTSAETDVFGGNGPFCRGCGRK